MKTQIDDKTQFGAHSADALRLCLAGAELTRYDGWFLAGCDGSGRVAVIALRRMAESRRVFRRWDDRALRLATVKFLLVLPAVPVSCGWHTTRRCMETRWSLPTDQYSAKAIEHRVAAPNPAFHNAGVAAILFFEIGAVEYGGGELGTILVGGGLGGIGNRSMETAGAQSVTLFLLWVPLVFYALSIAYGSVPLHVYTWWPFATFNQRLRTPVAADVRGFDRSADCVRVPGWRGRAARLETGGDDVGGGGGSVMHRWWKAEPQMLDRKRGRELRGNIRHNVL